MTKIIVTDISKPVVGRVFNTSIPAVRYCTAYKGVIFIEFGLL